MKPFSRRYIGVVRQGLSIQGGHDARLLFYHGAYCVSHQDRYHIISIPHDRFHALSEAIIYGVYRESDGAH